MMQQGDLLDPLDLVEHGDVLFPVDSRWPQRLFDLFEVMRAYNVRQRVADDHATRDAAERVALIAGYFGGRQLYLPTGETLRRALRDAAIFARFHRVGADALAREHQLTTKQIYEIVAQQRTLFVSRVQGRLFK